ncbi:hypothetical protein NYP80_02425 [Erwinia pyrifoliae]|uniref:hypothetical protein n=1 Tax=Erwinia pyrifoliae TaxID=79967 RepID=UPI0021C0E4E6|nr:hypothetical protein [Erwinia pyrifoliae]UXK12773.1 hypothetical protein NYP80_02425 [Erwinia pyrifoliae]
MESGRAHPPWCDLPSSRSACAGVNGRAPGFRRTSLHKPVPGSRPFNITWGIMRTLAAGGGAARARRLGFAQSTLCLAPPRSWPGVAAIPGGAGCGVAISQPPGSCRPVGLRSKQFMPARLRLAARGRAALLLPRSPASAARPGSCWHAKPSVPLTFRASERRDAALAGFASPRPADGRPRRSELHRVRPP